MASKILRSFSSAIRRAFSFSNSLDFCSASRLDFSSSLIIIFGICYLLIGFFNKKQIEKNSYTITKKSQDKIKSLQEGLGAIKDVLLGGSQEYYAKIFSKTDYPIRKLAARNSFLANSPKFLIETLGITFLAIKIVTI